MSAASDVLPAFFLSDDPREVLAAAAALQELSSGEVRKPETLNGRTGKPERDGLMCARIFGPVEDHRCLCGKLSGPEFAGQRCDRCGVLCGERRLRDERWGHIEFPGPLVHPRLVAAIAARLGFSLADLMALVRFEAELREDGRIVKVEYCETERGPQVVEARLGADAATWRLRQVPLTPPGWRGTRRDPQDLAYARLLNRGNRLRRLIELGAPQILLDNEQRQGQDALERLHAAVRAELQARRPIVVAPPSRRGDALLQAVHDDPDDDHARLAYGEHLADAGDLRGEFILRQVASARRGRSPQLERDMVRRNYERWIAPLAGAVADGVRFRRGFPSACKTVAGAAQRIGDPAWATIEHLETDLADLVADPVMRALESLVVPYRTLHVVCERDVVLPRVHTLRLHVPRCPPPRPDLVTRGDALPALSALTIVVRSERSDLEFSWLDDTPLAQRLTRLQLDLPLSGLGALALPWWLGFLARQPQLPAVTLVFGKHLVRFTARRDGSWFTLRVVFSRGAIERVAMGHAELAEGLARALTALAPHELLSLQVDGGRWWGDDLEALARTLRNHFGGVLTLPPGV